LAAACGPTSASSPPGRGRAARRRGRRRPARARCGSCRAPRPTSPGGAAGRRGCARVALLRVGDGPRSPWPSAPRSRRCVERRAQLVAHHGQKSLLAPLAASAVCRASRSSALSARPRRPSR
jgi:hypothetical protein